MCLQGPCELPNCRFKQGHVGRGGIGLAKKSPAISGLTQRERAHKSAHRTCEIEGCVKPTAHIHHVDRRPTPKARAESRLLAVCTEHHLQIHAGQLDDGRRIKEGRRG